MTERLSGTAIARAVARLRDIAFARPAGEFVGSEDELLARLGASRSTLRQAARLVEREGLLQVRRGINGGYFSARPDAASVEAAVATQLQLLEVDHSDTVTIASALWVEAVRKAAANSRTSPGSGHRETLASLLESLTAIGPECCFEDLRDCNRAAQDLIFAIGNSSYIKLIFDINEIYASRRLSVHRPGNAGLESAVVNGWRDAKMLELQSVAAGETELAATAARLERTFWLRLITVRFGSAFAAAKEV